MYCLLFILHSLLSVQSYLVLSLKGLLQATFRLLCTHRRISMSSSAESLKLDNCCSVRVSCLQILYDEQSECMMYCMRTTVCASVSHVSQCNITQKACEVRRKNQFPLCNISFTVLYSDVHSFRISVEIHDGGGFDLAAGSFLDCAQLVDFG